MPVGFRWHDGGGVGEDIGIKPQQPARFTAGGFDAFRQDRLHPCRRLRGKVDLQLEAFRKGPIGHFPDFRDQKIGDTHRGHPVPNPLEGLWDQPKRHLFHRAICRERPASSPTADRESAVVSVAVNHSV